jgi:tetratricopeptide (TPR) repeat protein
VGVALYGLTLCPTVHVAGTGENATAAAILGVPHPPGFPLFCLLGRLAVVLLPGPPVLSVNLLAAVAGAAAAAVVGWLVARLTGLALAGFGAGVLLAAARTFWSQAVIAEVYALSAFLLAVELALLLAWRGDVASEVHGGKGRGARSAERWFLAFGFAFGLGVSLHPLHAFMLPGYAALILTARRRPRPALLARCLALAALGLTLHLYPLLRSMHDPALDWGDPEDWESLKRYLTAAQYRGRMFSLGGAEIGENLLRFGQVLLRQWTPVLLLLPVAGLIALWARRRSLATGLGLMALADFVFAVNYDIPWEIEVYYIPLILVLAIAAGVGLALILERSRPAGMAAVAVAVVVPVTLNFADNDLSESDLVDRYGRDVLDSLPPDAVLVTPPTNPTFILLYLTAVEGERPDVRVLVRTESGLAPLGEALRPGAQPAVTAWSLASDERHPLFFADRDPLDDLPGYMLEPQGAVYRLARAGEEHGTRPREALRVDPDRLMIDPEDDFHLRLIAVRYLLLRADRAFREGDTTGARAEIGRARDLGGDLAAVEAEIALSLVAAGDREQAIAEYERALALEEVASIANRLGRLRLETGDENGAEGDFRHAIELDDELAMAHSNLGGLLGQRGDYEGAVVELERAVDLDPLSIKAHNNLGTALLLLGEAEGSAAAYRRSLALNPDQPHVRSLLARAEGAPGRQDTTHRRSVGEGDSR